MSPWAASQLRVASLPLGKHFFKCKFNIRSARFHPQCWSSPLQLLWGAVGGTMSPLCAKNRPGLGAKLNYLLEKIKDLMGQTQCAFIFIVTTHPSAAIQKMGSLHNRICYTVKTLDSQHSMRQFLESPSLFDNSVTCECFVSFLSKGTSSKSCHLSSAFCHVLNGNRHHIQLLHCKHTVVLLKTRHRTQYSANSQHLFTTFCIIFQNFSLIWNLAVRNKITLKSFFTK